MYVYIYVCILKITVWKYTAREADFSPKST